MHREFDPSDNPFRPRSHLPLYALTAVLAVLLVADLWPLLAGWLASLNIPAPTWNVREVFGVRFALAAAVLGGARALFTALEKVAAWRVGADLAVAVACVAAILIGEPLVAAEVVFIGLLGECLEAATFDRTQRALGKLTELFPQRCWVLRDGIEVRTLTADVIVGDVVVVKPGGRIPVDGAVTDGRSAVDASALTGESVPLEKGPGDAVLAGCVVRAGSLTVRAERVATATVAGRVIELTGKAIREKSGGERQADRLARYFLPVVLGLAVVAFAVNLGLNLSAAPVDGRKATLAAAARVSVYPALAVLVVACPCPLVLATPAAVIAALGRLAGTGVLVKSGAALERLAGVTAFAFDKTGTLTEGKLELGDVLPLGDVSPDDLLRTAAAAEARSEHPVARAVLAAARTRGLDVLEPHEFQAVPGGGVIATTVDGRILVGTRRFLVEQDVDVPAACDNLLSQLDVSGQTPLLLAKEGVLLGVIGARDRVRSEAAGVLADLRDLGMHPLTLLTGDRASVAAAVARDLSLTDVRAELLPADKAAAVSESAISDQPSAVGRPRTAYVGDGVNDAPALATAAVGIAIGTGTDIAAAAGDVLMMGDPLRPLPMLVRLARETTAIIRQNIVWFGFGVNIAGVLLAGFLWPLVATAPGWYEKAPLVGVLYHQLGSLAVLVNSMRLLAFERRGGGRVQAALAGFDRWLTTLHPHDLGHWLYDRRKKLLAGVLLVAVILWVLSGFTPVQANEMGVVQRFGAVRGTLEPGLHVRWPWPIEATARVRPAEVRTVEIGFRLPTAAQAADLAAARIEQDKLRSTTAGQTWASAHGDAVSRVSDESLLLTGDGDLIELLATVRYTVSDPRKYLFAAKEPDAVIRSAAVSVFRELASSRGFQSLLGSGRTAFEAAARSRLEARLTEATPDGLGVQLEGLTVHDLHPPQEVVPAYHAVADAIQKKERAVNEAKAESSRQVARAQEESLRTVRAAEAESARRVSEATATRDVILGWQAYRGKLSDKEEAALRTEIDLRTNGGESPSVVRKDVADRREKMIETRRTLTDFRLSLEAVVAVLRTRDKILVDADKLPGTRKLYLLDPDLMPKLPPPLAFPRTGPTDQRDP